MSRTVTHAFLPSPAKAQRYRESCEARSVMSRLSQHACFPATNDVFVSFLLLLLLTLTERDRAAGAPHIWRSHRTVDAGG
ncbi:hypothetical protein MHYP_G00042780 [Metynnis hypsauchen]